MNKNDLLIRQLCEDVADLKRRVAATPVVVSPYQPAQMLLLIDRGNTLVTGQFGIKHVATVIVSVPSAYDPNVTSTFIDGIGRAKLVKDGVIQDGYVLVCNDPRSAWRSAFITDDAVATTGAVSISYGAGSVTAYVPV